MRLHQLLQPLRQNMGVNLGGCDIGMSEQFLQAAQIGTMRQQVRGKGMVEHMRREAGGVEICFPGELFEQQGKSLAGSSPAGDRAH